MNRLISRIITSIWKKFESVLTEKEIKRLNAKEFIPVLTKLAQHDSIYYNRQNEISQMVNEPEVMRNYSVSVELSPASSCVWWWLWVVIVLSTTILSSVSIGVSGCFVQKKYFISLHGLILILLHCLASPTVTNLSGKFWIASCQKIAEIRIVAFNWKSSHPSSESLANKNETIFW